MENNPIHVMLEEHEVIGCVENIVNSLNKTWETDEEKYKQTVTSLIIFFREYADGYHHRKEEEILFPAIRNHPDFVLQEMIDEFETHHEDFRNYTVDIENALAAGDLEGSYRDLTRYTQDLLDHIGAENDELFVLAESLMNEQELETVFFHFKDIDRELGESRKKELENYLEALSQGN